MFSCDESSRSFLQLVSLLWRLTALVDMVLGSELV